MPIAPFHLNNSQQKNIVIRLCQTIVPFAGTFAANGPADRANGPTALAITTAISAMAYLDRAFA